MRICVFLPNWLGDVVMATPAFRLLKNSLPENSLLVGIGRPHLIELLNGTAFFDKFFPFNPKKGGSQGRFALINFLRSNRFDAAVLLTNSLSTAFLAWIGNSKKTIGYDMNWRRFFLTHRIHAKMNGKKLKPIPMATLYLDAAKAALKALGVQFCTEPSQKLELALTESDKQLGDTIWQNLALQSGDKVIAIHCGGAFGSAKRWPANNVAALAQNITDKLGFDALILCGPGEQDAARQIVALADRKRVFSLSEQPVGIGATKAALSRCRLTVATDSGPRHIAAAFGKPIVTLLGPTIETWIANSSVVGPFISLGLECSGCAERSCPQGHNKCMSELNAGHVLDRIMPLLYCENA